ncbi:MAG: hypothetical protein OHK0046_01370 [Anaerolineae bacterium]
MDGLRDFLNLFNETLAATIVTIAASLLLYNLTRNLNNRVARTSGGVLACVTAIYIGDVLVSLDPTPVTIANLLRFQWVGLAFLPATVFHLSDALLATTGLPSRGRRKRVSRLLYAIANGFLILAAFTDALIIPQQIGRNVSISPGPLFPLYAAYFVLINGIAFINVQRARRRCLTRSTERRMAYLQVAMLTPVLGVFPYSVLLSPGEEFTVRALVLVNAANLLIVFMLVFLAYPLSFFGSTTPDRVVKADLLRFFLRGPGTGLIALVVVIYLGPASRFLGVSGSDFLPFAVVAVILLWQWIVDLLLPWLERRLVYNRDDAEQLAKLDNLSERLLTRSDLMQLLEATLEAACDYLRVNRAFVTTLADQNAEMLKSIGNVTITSEIVREEALGLISGLNGHGHIYPWKEYWLIPLYSKRSINVAGSPTLIGMMGIEARADDIDLTVDDEQMLERFTNQAERTLDDLLLQTEIYAALEGLLPQIALTRSRAAEVEYRPGRAAPAVSTTTLDRDEVIEQVHAALRHYAGGPGISSNRLLDLAVVRNALTDNDNNPARALRAVLQQAIENQRPGGERDMKSPEWTLYNILTLRFVEGRKARETARMLYMSEANLYRKQTLAIEAVGEAIMQMETEAINRLVTPDKPV